MRYISGAVKITLTVILLFYKPTELWVSRVELHLQQIQYANDSITLNEFEKSLNFRNENIDERNKTLMAYDKKVRRAEQNLESRHSKLNKMIDDFQTNKTQWMEIKYPDYCNRYLDILRNYSFSISF